MKNQRWMIIFLLATSPLLLSAQDFSEKWDSDKLNRYHPSVDPTLKIYNVWVRPTIEGQDVTAAYMTIETPVNANIVAVYCPDIGGRIEFRETVNKDATSAFKRTRPLRYPIPIIPGRPLKVEPGANHMMMIGIKKTLKVGDKVLCTFQLSSWMYNKTTSAAISVMLPVRLPPAQPPQPEGQQPPSRPASTLSRSNPRP